MGGPIDMERKECELIIHNLWVTMVGRVDVPDIDWGEFRRWCAVNVSS